SKMPVSTSFEQTTSRGDEPLPPRNCFLRGGRAVGDLPLEIGQGFGRCSLCELDSGIIARWRRQLAQDFHRAQRILPLTGGRLGVREAEAVIEVIGEEAKK